MPHATTIKRQFVDVAHGQMHYRSCGSGAPMLLVHASPGSSKQIVALIAALADHGQVYAPDTPGNGDSPALPIAVPAITDLAAAYLRFLDAIGLDRVRLYGSHTGAAIAAELAILAPDRIAAVVLDGIQILSDEQLAQLMDHYAFPFTPDLDGAYLLRAFMFCRDQYVFFPWYDRTLRGQRSGGLPPPGVLHDWVVEVLKASETYHLNYRAAFQWQALVRLPLLQRPALAIAAANDPLITETRQAAAALPGQRFQALPRSDDADFQAVRAAAIMQFYADPNTNPRLS